jgi:hypothetical protein
MELEFVPGAGLFLCGTTTDTPPSSTSLRKPQVSHPVLSPQTGSVPVPYRPSQRHIPEISVLKQKNDGARLH